MRLAVACTAVTVAAVAISVVEVARPSPDGLGADVDAVLVHASNKGRLDASLTLMNAGVSDTLVVSNLGDYGRSPGAMARLCAQRQPEVVCVAPQSGTTLGEARAFGRVAAERGWQRVAVVTSRVHLTRAAMSVRQCTDAEVVAVSADPQAQPSMRRVRHEWIRVTATATLVRAC